MNRVPFYCLGTHAGLIASLVFLSARPLAARSFKSAEGVTVEAEVVLVKDGNVTLKRSDGRRFTHPLSFFSPEDQAALVPGAAPSAPATSPAPQTPKATEPQRPATQPSVSARPYSMDVRVSSGKSDRLSQAEFYDDRLLRLRFSVDITSRETTRELSGAKGTLIVLGKSVVDSRLYGVLGREEFPMELSIREPFHLDAKTITTEYDDKGSSSKYGYRYLGYVLVVQDASGAIVRADASPETYAKFAQKVLNLEATDVVDKNLDPAKGGSYTTVIVR
jgi:hypothetical protein